MNKRSVLRLNEVKTSSAFPKEDISAIRNRLEQLSDEEADQALETFLQGRAPLASFHLISDIHIGNNPAASKAYRLSLMDMARVFPASNLGLVIAGDITDYAAEEQYEEFYQITSSFSPVSAERTMILLGNHDVRGGNSALWNRDPNQECPYWKTAEERYRRFNQPYMPEGKLYHAKEIDGYTFIMLNTILGLKDAPYMDEEELAWFENIMRSCWENDSQKPVFIISHQPLNNTHWMSNVLDGFDGWNNEKGTGPQGQPLSYCTGMDQKVKNILTRYPIGFFLSGHIHTPLFIAEAQPRSFGLMLDIPCLCRQDEDGEGLGVGYEAAIYKDQIVFRARNFASGHWLPRWDKICPLPLVSYVYQKAKSLQETNATTPSLQKAIQDCETWMNRTYNQEGIPWDWTLPPEFPLFDDQTLEKIENDRQSMMKEIYNKE